MRVAYYILFITILALLVLGCKKSNWFDVKSDSSLTVPSTLQDFEYLLDDFLVMNVYNPGLAEVASDGHSITETGWIGIFSNSERNSYTWTNNLPYLKVEDWNFSYKRIFQCNLVLDGLKKISQNQDNTKFNQIKGNALFHRAKNYYDLAQIYAQPYNPTSANSDMGIPLKEGIDVTEPAKRSSVKDTYEQILTDLRNAANLLPSLPVMPTRGSKTAAFALLARTYLTIGDYTKAGLYADSSLMLYDKLIDFKTISATAPTMGQFNLETIYYSERIADYLSAWAPGYFVVDPMLYALYNANDLRKTRFFTVKGSDVIFKGNYTQYGTGFSGLAVDEQYLIRAECFARAGDIVSAMKDLNDLLKTRWDPNVTSPMKPYADVVAIDSEDALRKVLEERRKELLFRNLRWTDLRRLNLDQRFKVTLTRTVEGKTYTLEPGSYKYTLPIPQDVLNLAPQMTQAPGWK